VFEINLSVAKTRYCLLVLEGFSRGSESVEVFQGLK